MFGHSDTQTNDNLDSSLQGGPVTPPSNPFEDSSPVAGPPPVSATPPAPAFPTPTLPSSPIIPPPPIHNPVNGPDNALIEIKEQALQSLQPLVSQLDQSPEEKFKTTMMMIQATDNHSLVKQAYEAANQIVDEKARAQALLDVVNEINYFTHQDDKDA
jgi:hypothetical protein